MKLADIKPGVLYAVNYGSGIEPATAVEFERASLNGPTGVRMSFQRMRGDPIRWVGANRVIEPWTVRAERLQAERAADERWWDAMVTLSDQVTMALDRLGVETGKVRLRHDKMMISIEDPDDVRMLLWELNSGGIE